MHVTVDPRLTVFLLDVLILYYGNALHYSHHQGVLIVPNLTSVLYDKNEWETPYKFNPRHFLNEEDKFVRPAAFIPFSTGEE